ncbi:hypothetical protein HDV05_001787 [Chytridiales sp. JEL 0842]|nr:hypothetical protein HDV05_001787 [Chytridiales sp. JEL 0842]
MDADGSLCETLVPFLTSCASSVNSSSSESFSKKVVPGSLQFQENALKLTIDILLNAEMADENFHRYPFVKLLKKRLKKVIGPVLDDQMKTLQEQTGLHPEQPQKANSNSRPADVDPLIPAIVDRIMASPEYNSFVASVINEIKDVVEDKRTQTFQEKAKLGSSVLWPAKYEDVTQNQRRDLSFSTTSNVTNESSSGSLSSFLSAPIDEIHSLSRNLQCTHAFDVRWVAATKLDSFSIADLLSSEFWTEVRLALELALADNDCR